MHEHLKKRDFKRFLVAMPPKAAAYSIQPSFASQEMMVCGSGLVLCLAQPNALVY